MSSSLNISLALRVTFFITVQLNFCYQLTAAIKVEMPSETFGDYHWFSHARKSAALINKSGYKKLAIAESQEDIWAYENWFYGMSNGTMLVSGALDGIKYSTSYMFEKYADWKIIHIGINYFIPFLV